MRSKLEKIINNYLSNSGYNIKGKCDEGEYGVSDLNTNNYELAVNNKDYYLFPTSEELAKASIEDLRGIGLGFRDKRVYHTTQMILNKEIDRLKDIVSDYNIVADCLWCR